MSVWKFTYYSIKEPEKVGRYYVEDPEIALLFSYSAFLSDFCTKNHVERTDVFFRIERSCPKRSKNEFF